MQSVFQATNLVHRFYHTSSVLFAGEDVSASSSERQANCVNTPVIG